MERDLELPTAQMNHKNDGNAYPLLDALRKRRSRRFGRGMRIDSGPFAYRSEHSPQPLSEEEEAFLVFAACGIAGYALADLAYGSGQGGGMLMGLVGRTISSADAINSVSLVVTNDTATYLLKRPQDFDPAKLPEIIDLAQRAIWLPGTGAAGSRSTTGGPLRRWSRATTSISTSGRCTPKVERTCCPSTN